MKLAKYGISAIALAATYVAWGHFDPQGQGVITAAMRDTTGQWSAEACAQQPEACARFLQTNLQEEINKLQARRAELDVTLLREGRVVEGLARKAGVQPAVLKLPAAHAARIDNLIQRRDQLGQALASLEATLASIPAKLAALATKATLDRIDDQAALTRTLDLVLGQSAGLEDQIDGLNEIVFPQRADSANTADLVSRLQSEVELVRQGGP